MLTVNCLSTGLKIHKVLIKDTLANLGVIVSQKFARASMRGIYGCLAYEISYLRQAFTKGLREYFIFLARDTFKRWTKKI